MKRIRERAGLMEKKNRTKRVSKVKVRAAMKRMKSGKPLRIFMNAIK